MKVDKLTSVNQPAEWFEKITNECSREYPIHLVEDLQRDELVIDAGCNVGGFTEAFKWRFSNFLAIDASSYNIEQYQSHHHFPTMHKALYSKDNTHVQLRKYMVDGNDTETGSYGITGFTSEHNGHGWNSEEYEEVETISLEKLLAPYNEVGLLKIDIEGSEFDFLYKKDLSKIKYIVGEFHNFLFQYNDKGVTLLEYIEETHDEIYSDGDGINSHYVKLFKRR